MKNWLQYLLIFFALGLCVLLAVQWHGEDRLRRQLDRSTKTGHAVGQTIDSLTNDVTQLKTEIARLDGLGKKLATNATMQGHESAQWAELAVVIKEDLEEADALIRAQKETIRRLQEEREGLVKRYNDLAEDYNDLVDLWNAQREALTNAIQSLEERITGSEAH